MNMTPPLPQDTKIQIRAAAPDVERWRKAADAAGIKLSAWIKQQCNAAAKGRRS